MAYRRFSLNLHQTKDKKIINWIENSKNDTNISYSDVIRFAIVNFMNIENKKVIVQEKDVEKPKAKKPKFKFKEM